MKFRSIAAFLALSATLTACVSSSESTTPSPSLSAGFQAKFEPAGGVMPFPNDLLFNGSKTGQLNIPGSTTVAQNGPLLEQNHLDGFGTQSDISVYFTSSIDKSSITPADVIVLKVASDVSTKAVSTTGTVTPLKMGTDFSAEVSPGIDVGGSILTIKPLHPLAASTVDPTTKQPVPATYLVIVTNGLKDTSGNAASASPDYSKILAADLPVLKGGKMGTTGDATLNQVALFTLPQLAVAAGAKIDPTTIAITFSFSTEYLGISLAEIDATAAPTTQTGTGIFDTGQTVCDVLVLSKQLANSAACASVPGSTVTEVFAGDVALPYYLTVPAKGSTAALTDSWHNAKGTDTALNSSDPTSFVPKPTTTTNVIPVLVAIPTLACAMPGGGWPVVIFQHGITRNREDMLGIASTLAVGAAPGLCTAVIAIDLPLHGVTDTTDPFYKNQLFTGTPAAAALTAAVSERTFDMDANGVAGATGKNIGGSGAQFINLNSTITSRDNLREGAADLINLVATLPNMAAVGAGVNTFDSTQVFYVGHSLGGIIGTTFLGADSAGASLTTTVPKIKTATLANPGGHIAELLRTSAEFEPIIDAGLAKQGLVKGTQEYYDFYSQAQAVVEDGDPANYAVLAAAGHPIHMIEVVGGGDFGTGVAAACNLTDQVVPNSSTDLLASLMGLTQIDTTTPAAGAPGGEFIVRFLAGDHGSILSPAVPSNCTNNATAQGIYGAVTVEMQTEAISFIATGGAALPINNTPPVIKAP
jgi:pimeloyl-ACP methyl ester carboxylesterase